MAHSAPEAESLAMSLTTLTDLENDPVFAMQPLIMRPARNTAPSAPTSPLPYSSHDWPSDPGAPTTSRAPPQRTGSTQSFFLGPDGTAGPSHGEVSRDLAPLLLRNKQWSQRMLTADPNYFKTLCAQQAPNYFWVGCADSRVPANVVLGLEPGEVFVQRNVGNQAMHTDLNCMSCLEFAVKELKVKIVIVGGHYGCGAVKAALRWSSYNPGMCNMWISDIREARNQHVEELKSLDADMQIERLCEINVMRQTFHVCTSPIVQAAWKAGQQLSIYGLIYSLKDGLVKELVGPLRGNNDFVHDQATFEDLEPTPTPTASATTQSVRESANPLDTRAMANKLAAHTAWSNQFGM